MISVEILQELIKLGQLYESKWKKEVDFSGMPQFLKEDRLLFVMRLIAETGDNVLEGYKKTMDLTEPYFEYLVSVGGLNNGDIVDKKCPLCGGKVRYYKTGNTSEYKCDTRNCISIVGRGL